MPRPRKIHGQRNRFFKLRLTDEEWFNLGEQAEIAGLTRTEYSRRRITGQRIVSQLHNQVVNELRRVGGLQKHLSKDLPQYRLEFEAILEAVRSAIQSIDNTVAGAEEI